MLSGFLLDIVHDRRLMRDAQVNLAIRWFKGYGLHEELPNHSSLTRIRWGAERFRRIVERTVQDCVAANIAKGEAVHINASLIRADVSWESLVVRHADAVRGERRRRDGGARQHKKICIAAPDASMATSGRNRRLEPSYKQHVVVDDAFGVVLDVEVTTDEVNAGQVALARIDAAAETTGTPIRIVTADAGYAYAKVCGGLAWREIGGDPGQGRADPQPGAAAPLPLRRAPRRPEVPARRGPAADRPMKHGHFFCSRAVDCKGCDLEGYHGEAKTWHGLRARRQGRPPEHGDPGLPDGDGGRSTSSGPRPPCPPSCILSDSGQPTDAIHRQLPRIGRATPSKPDDRIDLRKVGSFNSPASTL